MQRPRSARLLIGASLMLGHALSASAMQFNFDLDFSADNHPIWDDTAPVFQETVVGVEEESFFGVGPFVEVGPVQVGARFGIPVILDVGIQTTVSDFHTGTADIDLPIDVTLEFPTTVRPGDTFRIDTDFSIKPTAGFNVTNDGGNVALNLGGTFAFGDVVAQFCPVVGCFDAVVADLPNNVVNLPNIDLYSVDKDSVTIHPGAQPLGVLLTSLLDEAGSLPAGWSSTPAGGLSIPSSVGVDINPDQTGNTADAILDAFISNIANLSGTLTSPVLNHTGTFDGTKLTGTVTDFFTDIQIDADALLPIPLGVSIGGAGGFEFGFDILNLLFEIELFARQTIDVTPGVPQVTLDLGPLSTHTIALGDSLELTIPDDFDLDSFDVRPTFSLDGLLENNTGLVAGERSLIQILRLILLLGDLINFDGAALTTDISDGVFSLMVGDNEVLSTDCDGNPELCNALSIFGSGGDEEMYSDTVPVAFGPISAQSLNVAVQLPPPPPPPPPPRVDVPEPSTLLLLAFGAPLAARLRRRGR